MKINYQINRHAAMKRMKNDDNNNYLLHFYDANQMIIKIPHCAWNEWWIHIRHSERKNNVRLRDHKNYVVDLTGDFGRSVALASICTILLILKHCLASSLELSLPAEGLGLTLESDERQTDGQMGYLLEIGMEIGLEVTGRIGTFGGSHLGSICKALLIL